MTREEVKAMSPRDLRLRIWAIFAEHPPTAQLLDWLAGDNRAPCLRHSWALDVWEASGTCAGETVTFEDKEIGIAVMRLYVYLYAA